MSTEREATPRPWRVYKDGNAYRVGQDTGAVCRFGTAVTGWGRVTQSKADADLIVTAVNSFDTMRDALREIAKGAQSGDRLPFDTVVRMRRIASSALAAIDGKDGGDGADAG